MGIFKFLKSLTTLAKNRNITIKEAYKFAEQEFGQVNDLLKMQINKSLKKSKHLASRNLLNQKVKLLKHLLNLEWIRQVKW